MRGNYPPGVHSGTPGAPWNDPPAPECDVCRNVIHESSDHEEGCELEGWSPTDFAEAEASQAAEMRFEAQREKELGL